MYVTFPREATGQVRICYREALLSTLLHVSVISASHNRPSKHQLQSSANELLRVSFPISKGQVPISYREAIMSTLLHVLLSSHNRPRQYQFHWRTLSIPHMEVSIPQPTTGLEPISYRGTMLCNLPSVSLISTIHNRIQTIRREPQKTLHFQILFL
jgi:hypothetical protein